MEGREVEGHTQNEDSLGQLKRDVLWIRCKKVYDVKKFVDWTVC
jgi:hypothetical protein